MEIQKRQIKKLTKLSTKFELPLIIFRNTIIQETAVVALHSIKYINYQNSGSQNSNLF